jgi:hypothetical protein
MHYLEMLQAYEMKLDRLAGTTDVFTPAKYEGAGATCYGILLWVLNGDAENKDLFMALLVYRTTPL